VDDGVEESLEIDAFREAVGSDEQPLCRGAHVIDTGAAFVRGKYSGSGHKTDLVVMCADSIVSFGLRENVEPVTQFQLRTRSSIGGGREKVIALSGNIDVSCCLRR
jgi:hypothetical protein